MYMYITGVEQVVVDRENQKVIVKGKNAEPLKVLKRVRKKYSKNVDLIFPKLEPNNNTDEAPPNKEPEHLPLKTVILKTSMHCEGCASDVRRSLEKMKGVVSVDVNRENSQVAVRGVVDAIQVAQLVKNRFGKHVEIVNQGECCCCGCKREAENGNQEQEINNNEDLTVLPCPPHHNNYFSCQTFSDENVFSCLLM